MQKQRARLMSLIGLARGSALYVFAAIDQSDCLVCRLLHLGHLTLHFSLPMKMCHVCDLI